MHTLQGAAEPALADDSRRTYPREVSADGRTQHSQFCQRTVTRWDWSRCHRCAELMCFELRAGDPVRDDLVRRLGLDLGRAVPFTRQDRWRAHANEQGAAVRQRRALLRRLAEMHRWLPIGG